MAQLPQPGDLNVDLGADLVEDVVGLPGRGGIGNADHGHQAPQLGVQCGLGWRSRSKGVLSLVWIKAFSMESSCSLRALALSETEIDPSGVALGRFHGAPRPVGQLLLQAAGSG